MPVTQDALLAVAYVVVFAALLAFIFLGERLEGFHAAGIAAIVTGIVLATSAGRGAKPGAKLGR